MLWKTIPALILTHTLAAQTPAPADDIRGPKPLIEIPEPEKFPIGLWLGIAGAGLLLALAAWLIRRKLRQQQLRTPPEIALSSLAKLETSREQLSAESFANRAADTVRSYIAGRFLIAAPKLTTEEFLRTVAGDKGTSLATESDHLRAFLKSCDLAKFAGTSLDASQRANLIKTARAFVKATTPRPASKSS